MYCHKSIRPKKRCFHRFFLDILGKTWFLSKIKAYFHFELLNKFSKMYFNDSLSSIDEPKYLNEDTLSMDFPSDVRRILKTWTICEWDFETIINFVFCAFKNNSKLSRVSCEQNALWSFPLPVPLRKNVCNWLYHLHIGVILHGGSYQYRS